MSAPRWYLWPFSVCLILTFAAPLSAEEDAPNDPAPAVAPSHSRQEEAPAIRNLLNQGLTAYRKGDHEAATNMLQRAIKGRDTSKPPTPEDFRAVQLLGRVFVSSRSPGEAIPVLKEAEQLGKMLELTKSTSYRDCLVDLAMAYGKLRRTEECEAYLVQAIRIEDSSLILNRLGRVYQARGKHGEAIEVFQRAISSNVLPNRIRSYPLLQESFLGLLKCYAHLGRNDELTKTHERILALYDGTIADSSEHPLLLEAAATFFRERNSPRLRDALELRARSRAAAKGESHPETVQALSELAAWQQNHGQREQSVATYQSAVDAWEKGGHENDVPIADILLQAAGVANENGVYERAERFFKLAIAAYEARGPKQSREIGECHSRLARIYGFQDRDDLSAAHLEQAIAINLLYYESHSLKILIDRTFLAGRYLDLKQIERARSLILSALERPIEVDGPETANALSFFLHTRAQLKCQEGDVSAIEDFRRSLEIVEQHCPSNTYITRWVPTHWAQACQQFSESTQAIESLPILLDVGEKCVSQPDTLAGQVPSAIVDACARIDRQSVLRPEVRARCLELMDAYVKRHEQLGLQASRDLGVMLRARGRILLDEAPADAAEPLLRSWQVIAEVAQHDLDFVYYLCEPLLSEIREAGVPAETRIPLVRQYMEFTDQAHGPKHPQALQAKKVLVGELVELERFDEASTLVDSLSELPSEQLQELQLSVARGLVTDGETNQGIARYHRVMTACEAQFGVESKEAVNIKIRSAREVAYYSKGIGNARPCREFAVSICRQVLATLDTHPDLADDTSRLDAIGCYLKCHGDGGMGRARTDVVAAGGGEFQEVIGRYQEGVLLATSLDNKRYLTELHNRMMQAYGANGYAAERLDCVVKAYHAARDLDSMERIHSAYCLAYECRMLGRYAEAERYYREAIEHARANKIFSSCCTCLGSFAIFLNNELDRPAEAIVALRERQTLAMGHSKGSRANWGITLAVMLQNAGKYAEAEQQALRVIADLQGDEKLVELLLLARLRLARFHIQLGEKRAGTDRHEKVSEQWTEICNLMTTHKIDLQSLDDGVYHHLALVAYEMGDLELAWRCVSSEFGHVSAALKDSELDLMRKVVMREQLRVSSAAESLACLALELKKDVDVLQVLESSRAQALQELTERTDLRLSDQLPEQERRDYEAARLEVNQLRAEIAKAEAEGLECTAISDQLGHAERRFDVVTLRLEEQYRRLFSLKSIKSISSAEAVSCPALDDDTALVGWVNYADIRYAYVLRRGRVSWIRLPDHELSVEIARQFFEELSTAKRDGVHLEKEIVDGLHDIYSHRFQPLLPQLEGVKNLIIVSQGWTNLLPVEMLVAELPSPETVGVRDPVWLTDRYAISYTPSVTMLDILTRDRQQATVWQKDLLVLADPPFDDEQLARMHERNSQSLAAVDQAPVTSLALRSTVALGAGESLPPLPGTRGEAEAIRRCFDSGSCRILLGPDASEAALQAMSDAGELEQYRYVHLATHGYVDPARPDFSGLVLAQAPRTPGYDGRLQMREVFGLAFNADLVVLSACQTGQGRTFEGEGVMGLSTAFLSSGADSLIMSLWNVPDLSTSLLMQHFYERLRSGDTKAKALQEAKQWLRTRTEDDVRKLLTTSPELVGLSRGFGEVQHSVKGEERKSGSFPFAHPNHWAGFVLTGHPK